MGNTFFRNGNAFARARVAAHARRAPVERKTAKTTNLYAVPTHQRIAHGVKNRLDGIFGIAVGQLAETCSQFLDKIASGHKNEGTEKWRAVPGSGHAMSQGSGLLLV